MPTDIFLYISAPNPADIILSDPTVVRGGGSGTLYFQSFTASMNLFSGALPQVYLARPILELGLSLAQLVTIINNSIYPDYFRLSAASALLLHQQVTKRNWYRDRLDPVTAIIVQNMDNIFGFKGYIDRARDLLSV